MTSKKKHPKELTGMQFGYLTAVERDPNSPTGRQNNGHTKWICRCQCGVEISTDRWNLLSGNTKSCGCYRKEKSSKNHTTHGKSRTSKAYRIWVDLKTRYNKGKIQLDPEWETFEPFLKAMGEPSPSRRYLCKFDPDLPYASYNCFWGTSAESGQGNQLQKWHKWNGSGYTLKQLCAIYQADYLKTYMRMSRGESLKQALGIIN